MKKIKILCPVDFSETSENALKYAFDFASVGPAELLLVHVVNPAKDALSLSVLGVSEDVLFEKTETAKDKLERECEKLGLKNHYKKISPGFTVRIGFLADEITDLAIEKNVDFIVMGTEGAINFEKRMFGTNTATVFNNAHCPVLVVPSNAKFLPFKNIIYASDAQGGETLAAEIAVRLAKNFNSHLHFINVQKNSIIEKNPLLLGLNKLIDKNQYKDISYNMIKSDDVESAINEYSKKHEGDLIVMVTRERGIWEKLSSRSITNSMAQKLTQPILVMHKQIGHLSKI